MKREIKCRSCDKVFGGKHAEMQHWNQKHNEGYVRPDRSRAKATPGKISDPDWSKKCESCGEPPVVPETGMCGPCTFGEAETAGGNW